MDKPILTYDVRQQENRASGGVMFVPRIVERNNALPLGEVIVRAIRQGRIVGIKESAASAIADAIARQMYEEFREGNGVRFGNYFYARVYLKGTSDGNGTLSADRNEIVVNLVKGEGFKLSLDMFDLQFRGAASIPIVDFLISEDDDAERGILVPGENVLLNGSSLWAETDDATRVRFTKVVDSGDAPVVEVQEFIARGPALLSFAYPSALDAGRWAVEVLRTDANGTTRRSSPVEITA